jgi:nucleotidyltransferase/DNA polymerase involved in DNA repair
LTLASITMSDQASITQICSDRNKPNGQFELTFEGAEIRKFMRDLPIRTIPGIGRVHERVLKSMGVDVGIRWEVQQDDNRLNRSFLPRLVAISSGRGLSSVPWIIILACAGYCQS